VGGPRDLGWQGGVDTEHGGRDASSTASAEAAVSEAEKAEAEAAAAVQQYYRQLHEAARQQAALNAQVKGTYGLKAYKGEGASTVFAAVRICSCVCSDFAVHATLRMQQGTMRHACEGRIRAQGLQRSGSGHWFCSCADLQLLTCTGSRPTKVRLSGAVSTKVRGVGAGAGHIRA
jgi:hypothetical protein